MITKHDAQWGVIRYAPGTGLFPEDDAAAFDGWYVCRDDALAVAEDFVARHPQWTVALVRSERTWFGDRDAAMPIATPQPFRVSRP
jgi:hypothetical protein